MTQKPWLYFALGIVTVISLGAVTNQIVPLAPGDGMSFSDTSIRFADGSEQSTAAADPAFPANNAELDSCSIAITTGNNTGTCTFDEVPVGKILVVEFLSGEMAFPSGQSGEAEFQQVHPSGFFTHHNLLHRYQYTNSAGDAKYNVSQVLRLYVPAENELAIRVIRNTTTGDNVYADFWLTGYYVDALP